MADDQKPDGPEERRGIATLVGAGVIAVLLGAFVIQNDSSIEVQWLFVEQSSPLWLVIVVSAVAGAVLSEVLGWLIRRRRD
jgi:uncharacterized integral membrane protein